MIVITAGPTIEPIDEVRRLTNFSTGTLGTFLAQQFRAKGKDVCLLASEARVDRSAEGDWVKEFGTRAELEALIEGLAGSGKVRAVLHCAAVGDYELDRVEAGSGVVQARKISSEAEALTIVLKRAPKILPRLREWFPDAVLIGWKYELEEDREAAVMKGRRQIETGRTNASVVNGAAYGEGFGLLTEAGLRHCEDRTELFAGLEEILESRLR